VSRASSPSRDEPRAGSVLAHKYRVEHVLGEGGMAVVVAAMHAQLQELVAIKLLRRDIAARPGAIERFVREARVAMKMRGEHAVRIHDVGMLDDGVPFIVMEHLEGEDLGTALRRRGAVEPRLAADYVVQACEALSEAHSVGIVHRDLKPSNLFLATRVDGSSCIKVLDFGVSKVTGGEPSPDDGLAATAPSSTRLRCASPIDSDSDPTITAPASYTRTNALIGSPRYMAPEQIRAPRDVDPRADVWGLGVVLYELLCGEPPFRGDTIDQVREAIAERRHPPLSSRVSIPPLLEAVVDTCLAKDPADRFQDVESLARALGPFAATGANASIVRIARIVAVRRAPFSGPRFRPTAGACAPTLSPSPSPSFDHAPAKPETCRQPERAIDARVWIAWAVAAIALVIAAAFALRP
jgi:serine/threonine-protein kinase